MVAGDERGGIGGSVLEDGGMKVCGGDWGGFSSAVLADGRCTSAGFRIHWLT